MLDFTNYQTIFNFNTTEERCRTVLDEIAPQVKRLFQDFTQNINIPLNNGTYFTYTYDAIVTTTYHDARNPKYAEQKKDSDIGRKYFVKLMKRIDTSKVSALTLEFNGLERTVYICIETKFIPIWATVRTKQLKQILEKRLFFFSMLLHTPYPYRNKIGMVSAFTV